MRRSAALVTLLGLLALAACESGPRQSATPSSSTAGAPSSSSAVPAPPAPASCDGGEVVEVTSAQQLQDALGAARPGQTIHLADGHYPGNFVTAAHGTADAPIRLCGARAAVLDGGPTDGDYTLHLDGAAHWLLSGFTVTGGQKGVMVDAGVGNRIEGLLVQSTGDEAIHLRAGSTDNAVVGNTVRDTGRREPKFGEGVYIGSAESNWCRITDCRPDRSDRNLVEGNDIAGTTAEAVDIKEGTSDGVLRGNRFDGGGMTEADSWVDVKGNGWTIERNAGSSSPQDGFQVHEVVDGWGQKNVFSGNTAGGVPGYAINVAGPKQLRSSTTVACDNDATGAEGGLSNVDCVRR